MYSDWITKTNHNLQKVIKTLPAIMTKAAHKTNTDLMSRIFHLFFNDHILLGSRRRALPRQNFLPENLNEKKEILKKSAKKEKIVICIIPNIIGDS